MDLKVLITLLAIVNPLGVIPFYLHITQGYSESQRQRTARIAAFTVFAVIAVSALLGLKLLAFFGVSLASFQVGGGLLLIISALSMLNAQPAEGKSTTEEVEDAAARDSVAVVPLAIPLLTGPATMSAVVILADKSKTILQHGMLVVDGLIVALAVWLTLTASLAVARVLGRTGINVMTRIMGLILAALAVELMSDGLQQLFPVLAPR